MRCGVRVRVEGRTKGERGAARDQEHAHRRDSAARRRCLRTLQQAAGRVVRAPAAPHCSSSTADCSSRSRVARGGGAGSGGSGWGRATPSALVGIVRVEEAAALRRGPPGRVGAGAGRARVPPGQGRALGAVRHPLHATRARSGHASPRTAATVAGPRDPTREKPHAATCLPTAPAVAECIW